MNMMNNTIDTFLLDPCLDAIDVPWFEGKAPKPEAKLRAV